MSRRLNAQQSQKLDAATARIKAADRSSARVRWALKHGDVSAEKLWREKGWRADADDDNPFAADSLEHDAFRVSLETWHRFGGY